MCVCVCVCVCVCIGYLTKMNTHFGPDTADNMDRFTNIVNLWTFKLMTILFKAQLIRRTNGIVNFSNHFI